MPAHEPKKAVATAIEAILNSVIIGACLPASFVCMPAILHSPVI